MEIWTGNISLGVPVLSQVRWEADSEVDIWSFMCSFLGSAPESTPPGSEEDSVEKGDEQVWAGKVLSCPALGQGNHLPYPLQ